MRVKGWVLVPILMLVALFAAPPVWADAYTDQVAGKFSAQTHVVADPAANPPLKNPDELNRQIVRSKWSWASQPPVWVAAVAPGQTGVTTPDALHNIALNKNPKFSGVIMVIDSKGYHVRAYNVPKAVANSVDDYIGEAAKSNKGNPDAASSAFVSRLAGLKANSRPVGTSANASEKHNGWSVLWVVLIVIAGLALMALLAYYVIRHLRRQREQEEARESMKSRLIEAEYMVAILSDDVVNNPDVDTSAEATQAGAALADAKAAYKSGDYTTARAHIKTVALAASKAKQKAKAKASSGLQYQDTPANPSSYLPPKPNVDAVKAVPKEQRKQATVKATDPQGQTVTINNNNYSTQQRSGYDNYYGGGYYNGAYFYPGYYPYSFWGPGWSFTDVLLMDALLDDHWGGDYGNGFDGGYDSQQDDTSFDGGDTTDYDSQQGDVGFDGSDDTDSSGSDTGFDGGQEEDSGGSDTDFSGDDTGYDGGGDTSDSGGYDSPSYADTSGGYDSGGYDSGGGGDFGGDFGGGGDSGF